MIFSKYDMFDVYARDLEEWEASFHEDDCPACGNRSLDEDSICTLPECGVDALEYEADQREENYV